MTIYVICVNPESGKTLAISADDPSIRAYGWNGADEALGTLVRQEAERGVVLTVDRVVAIDTAEVYPPSELAARRAVVAQVIEQPDVKSFSETVAGEEFPF